VTLRIVLVRHGKPGLVSRASIAGRDIGLWVRHYDDAGISRELAPRVWVPLARVAWWLNWCDSDETIATTRQRAGRVADRLGALAAEYGSVMAIGHGMFNRFVASQLRRRGWRGPNVWSRRYWAAAEFE
jgi:broad specificity phosphatase PhoE